MKFRIKIKDINGEWWEDYDENIEDIDKWAKEVIKRFNKTLRPGENKRKKIELEILDNDNKSFHNWYKRTDGMSVEFRGTNVDIMQCSKCGITGKRYGISSIKIDSKYRKKVYLRCDTARKYKEEE